MIEVENAIEIELMIQIQLIFESGFELIFEIEIELMKLKMNSSWKLN